MRDLQGIVWGGFAAACALTAMPLRAQCPEWDAVGAYPGASGIVFTFATFDDGSGEKLYAGGTFQRIMDQPFHGVARWDGQTWEPVGALPADAPTVTVNVLRVLDLGSGPQLFAGGDFDEIGGVPANAVARWDGAQWQPLGLGLGSPSSYAVVHALEVFHDGGGAALYAGGQFTKSGSTLLGGLARWNGSAWSDPGRVQGTVHALQTHDDGSGSALYAGGWFSKIAGLPMQGIGRFDGSSWSAISSGLTGTGPNVQDLEVHDDGNGVALYACGRFGTIDGVPANNVARWNGTGWSAVGSGLLSNNSTVEVADLHATDLGSGVGLYAVGQLVKSGPVATVGIARWNGSAWSGVGGGVKLGAQTTATYALGDYDSGTGRELFVGGYFANAGGLGARGLVRWDESAWHGWGGGFDGWVRDFVLHDDGSGAALYAVGDFTVAAGVAAECVARLGGRGWQGLDFKFGEGTAAGVDSIRDAASFDDGGGPALFVAGPIHNFDSALFRWRAGVWTHVVTFDGTVSDIEVFDDGSGAQLYVVGNFHEVGSQTVHRAARWDGTTWSQVGAEPPNGPIHALEGFDDGSGLLLYAAGSFLTADGVTAVRIASWNGVQWSPLLDPGGGLAGVDKQVFELAVHDDGTGPALYVGGEFQVAGPITAGRIARWDGSAWSALGAGVSSDIFSFPSVQGMASYDDGSASRLYVCGDFTTAGGLAVELAAAWDGSAWSALPGMAAAPDSSRDVAMVRAFDLGNGPALAWGGLFAQVGGAPSSDFAIWRGCADASLVSLFCFGDGASATCPCSNHSSVGARVGCVNSLGEGGRLRASGNPSLAAADLVLRADLLPPGRTGVLIASASTGLQPFGDGLSCLGSPREFVAVSVADPLGAIEFAGIAQALAVQPGQGRFLQVWYRDPPSPCLSTFNLTNAAGVVFTP